MNLPVITYTTGIGGSGKTYSRCAYWLTEVFFTEHAGKIYTNFPIIMDAMTEYVRKNRPQLPVDTVEKRVKLISEHVLRAWREEKSGPWEYFQEAENNPDGNHFSLDEIHHYCPKTATRKYRKQWEMWLGELRHQGMTAEFLTQSPHKVAKEIEIHAARRISLINTNIRRDPFFKIEMFYWLNLKAKVTGKYNPKVFEIEKDQLDGKWVQTHQRTFCFEPQYFSLYKSFSKPQAGGVESKEAKKPFETKKWPGLLWWFFRNNAYAVTSRVIIFIALLWLFAFGGFVGLIKHAPEVMIATMEAQTGKKAQGFGQSSQSSTNKPANAGANINQSSTGCDLAGNSMKNGQAASCPSSQPASQPVEQFKKSEFVCLANDRVFCRDGRWYKIGEKITSGKYENRTVKSISVHEALVHLDDGTTVHLPLK